MPSSKTRELLVKPQAHQTSIDWVDPITKGIYAFWPLNDGGTGSKISDVAGNYKLTATLTGTPTWTPGQLNGRAISFNGSSSIDTGQVPKTQGNQITVSAWVKPSALTRGDMVTCWFFGGANSQFNLLHSLGTAGTIEFYVSDITNTLTSLETAQAMVTGRWYHICGTFDGVTSTVYFNGILGNSNSGTVTTLNTTSLKNIVLGNNSAPDASYSGVMENVGIWNRCLKANEVRRLYTEPLCPLYVPTRLTYPALPVRLVFRRRSNAFLTR